ncbi:drug/metabolite transporter (DMT)-like permease [Sphingomonas aurantiaca]|uniref:Drug/metabolite transporter (DMT)-like permease n=1 Tax=Sphingomonas aurantiaca TaxID=185949 RepID=A0A2T5GTU4_9SPHN|nr:DMT family transporter [Sphingomonas aurantiaca]PTQ62738.1 drug/metabolite transporter (DMT)-like permease [Sphingomonas aurantiaca]
MPSDRILPAIGMRLLSVVIFALMNSAIKLAERHGASVSEILFFRQFGACLLVSGVILAGPGLPSIATKRLPAHVVRAVVGLSAMAFTFNGIVALPLAEATTIGFTVPVFATILGALVLREPTGWHRWAAVATGFAGVLIVAQPGGDHFPLWGAGCALAGAFGTASVSILLRQIGKTESALTTVFWFSALSLVPLSVIYARAAQPHELVTWACLASVGILGGLAQIAMTTSLRLGPVSVVVPMDYSSLLWATLLGWLVFDTLPAKATWFGAPVIVASGLYIVWREHVRRQEETDRAIA